MRDYHQTVLLTETINYLKVNPGDWYVDATLGDGGHSLNILTRGGKVFGIDVDPDALQRSQARFKDNNIDPNNYMLQIGNFRYIDELIPHSLAHIKFKGIIFDLGVSTLQLVTPQRGFSFQNIGPLDMRMDPMLSVTAMDLVNALNKGELTRLFEKYGEVEKANKIAEVMIKKRPFQYTTQLAEVIEKALGPRVSKIHPATKVFQALRIAVNDEINSVQIGLQKSMMLLDKNADVVVISFHSLEDRIVKKLFNDWQKSKLGEVVTDKPITSSDFEVAENYKSRSAKLRVFTKW